MYFSKTRENAGRTMKKNHRNIRQNQRIKQHKHWDNTGRDLGYRMRKRTKIKEKSRELKKD